MELKIGVTFYDDYAYRGNENPEEVRRSGNTVIIRRDDPTLPEFVDDARWYADSNVDGCDWLIRAARTLLRSLERQGYRTGWMERR